MNFRKFTLKHITLVTLAPAVTLWLILTVATYSHPENAGYNGLASMAVMFLTSFVLKKYHSSFMKNAELKLYNECDPYPMIDELNLYTECAGRRVNKTGLTVTLAMMTSFAGDHESAERMLRSIDISEKSGASAVTKAGILYSLAAVYCSMDLREHAVDCCDRAKQELLSLPDNMRKKVGYDGVVDAEVQCYKGDPDGAAKALEEIETNNRFNNVIKTFSLAKIHYIGGNRACAVKEFEWVAENGGRLGCASEAAEIAKTAKEMM